MRIFILTLAASVIALSSWAVPAKRVQSTHRQSDGTTVTVVLSGDEHCHGYETLDGKLVMQAENGDWCYASREGVSSMIAHNTGERSIQETEYVERYTLALTETAPAARRAQRRITTKDDADWSQVQKTGSPHIPIILVNYNDIKFKSPNPIDEMGEFLDNAFNYFKDQSFEQFTPQFDILGLVDLKENRATYGGNSYGDDKGVGKMVAEACLGVSEDIDWSLYDHDGDNQVDIVIVLYAGPGEAQGASSSTVWPCQWNLSESDYRRELKIGDYIINDFAVFNELYGSRDSGTEIDGIGTFCHEFSHCLGLPDFYSTGYYSTFGMDVWSLLDYGCYNNEGYTPVGYTAYERNFMGWMPIETLEPNTLVTLQPLQQSGTAYKIANDLDASGNEYFIIECRKQAGWDSFMPTSGLLINHVDYSAKAWHDNTVNNDPNHLRMTIVPADNSMSTYDTTNDLYPYTRGTTVVNNQFTDTSSPAAQVFTSSESPRRLHKPMTHITKNDNGDITLLYMPLQGDVNGDNVVDVTDANLLINIALGRESLDNHVPRAYVDGDNIVDINDINIVINKILNK